MTSKYQLVIKADLPYVVKQIEESDNRIRIEQINDYYEENRISDKKMLQVIKIEKVHYFCFKFPHVIPLNLVIHIFEQQQLGPQDIQIVNTLIDQIIYQTEDLYTKRQLNHNNIAEENILIISNFDHFYTWNRLESFDVKLVNFANNITIPNEEAYKKDMNSLRILIEKLLRLVKRSINIQAFTNHFEFNSLKIDQTARINLRKYKLFERKCTYEQENAINTLLSQDCNKNIEMPIKIIRSIFFQLIYRNGFDGQRFQPLLDELSIVELKIQELQGEFQDFQQKEIKQASDCINQHFKFQIKELTMQQVNDLAKIFGQNLFQEYFQFSNFTYNKESLFSLKEQAYQIFETSKIQISLYIKDYFQIILQKEILGLIKDLI